jgi:hypothetical protein
MMIVYISIMYSTFEKTWEERIVIPFRQFVNIQPNELRSLLEKFINTKLGGKCNEFGYMINKSAKVVEHTSAKIEHDMVVFYATITGIFFNCEVGDKLNVIVNSVTQIGIKGVCPNEKNSPYMVYVPIEFIEKSRICEKTGLPLFTNDEVISIKVEAKRYNNKDAYITCIGKYIEEEKKIKKTVVSKTKPKRKVKTYETDSEED